MKQTTINLPLVIYRTDQPKKDGSNTFCLQLHHNKVKRLISLKVSCTKEHYDAKYNRIKKSHPFSDEYNLIIETQFLKASKILLDSRIKDEPITINEFLNRYLGKDADNTKTDFFAFVDKEILLEQKIIEKKPGTLKKYRDQCNKLKKYKPKLEFNDINETFLANLEVYMRETLGNAKGGSSNTLKFIRNFSNRAIEKGLTDNNPFKNYKIKEPKNDEIKHLEIEELQKIKVYFETLDFNHKHFRTLKSFLFGCYTSCRYGDCEKFKLADIVNDCVIVQQEKTNKRVFVPLMPQTRALLNYDLDINLPNLNTPCNQTCNRALKEVAKICKINKRITFHNSRHTFGYTAVNNGVPQKVVQEVMGHSSSKQTDHYAKLNNDTKKLEMAKLNNLY